MTITAYGAQAQQLVPFETAEFGNLRAKTGTLELAALAQNESAAICKLPTYCTLVAVLYAFDALGSNTSVAIGTETLDGTADTTAIKATAATTSASSGIAVPQPVSGGSTVGKYVTVTNTGSGAATGTATVTALYIHNGG